MGSRRIAIANLVLRFFILKALAASMVVMVFFNNSKDVNGDKSSFKDLLAFRYVVATAGVGVVYTVIQFPFAIYQVCKQDRMIRNGYLPEFDFYGDKIISYVLATGVGAGFGVTFELKSLFRPLSEQLGGESSDELTFLDRGNIAIALLALGFIFMAILSILSSISLSAATTAKDPQSYLKEYGSQKLLKLTIRTL